MPRLLSVSGILASALAIFTSGAAAQVPTPAITSPPSASAIGRHEQGSGDRCRSASRIGAIDAHERAAILCLDSLELGQIRNLTELLSSRIPGVLVQQTSGTPGTAARIRIRGQGSILLENEPLVVIDGVRILGAPVATMALVPQIPSRLDDFNIADIAVIEVLRGPATNAMYGTGAAHGVIRITTRRGGRAASRWTAFAEAGPVLEPTRYPANYAQSGTRAVDGEPIPRCTLDARARGFCVADATPLTSFNPLEQASQFRRGLRQDVGASVSGGNKVLGYHAAAGHSAEAGVLDGSDLSRNTVRLNLDLRPMEGVAVSLSSAYLASDAHFPKGDYVFGTVLLGGLLGRTNGDPPYLGYSVPPDSLNMADTRQEVRRLDAGLGVEWRTPLSWLTLAAGLGVDRTDTDDRDRVPSLDQPPREVRSEGTLRVDKQTMGAAATASWSSGASLRGTMRLGIDRDDTEFDQSAERMYGEGIGLSWTRSLQLVTTGLYAGQELAWRDRILLGAGLRRDASRSTTRGDPEPWSRSAALSWLVRAEPEPARDVIGALRLHLGYGDVPGPTYSPNLPLGIVIPAFSPGGDLEVERTAEIEGGVTSSFLQDRLRVSFTAYRKTTTDGFVLDYGGYGPPTLVNGAEVQNTGFEGTLSASVLSGPRGQLSVELGMWRNSNQLVRLDRIRFIILNPSQRHVPGYPLGGYWERTMSYDDLNDDGIISRVNCPDQPQAAGGPACEIEMAAESEYLGSPAPRFEAFLAPKLSLFDLIEISALVDYRSGFTQFNQTEAVRCRYDLCRAASDPNAPLDDQARAIGVSIGGNRSLFAFGSYVEDATFAKLRELAVSVRIPASLTQAVGGRSARFTLAGRNLATWTGYSGLDPEISGSGPLGFGQVDAFTQPPLRYYTARLTIGL